MIPFPGLPGPKKRGGWRRSRSILPCRDLLRFCCDGCGSRDQPPKGQSKGKEPSEVWVSSAGGLLRKDVLDPLAHRNRKRHRLALTVNLQLQLCVNAGIADRIAELLKVGDLRAVD